MTYKVFIELELIIMLDWLVICYAVWYYLPNSALLGCFLISSVIYVLPNPM